MYIERENKSTRNSSEYIYLTVRHWTFGIYHF